VSGETRGLQRESQREETYQRQLRKIDAISLNPNVVGVGESTYRAVWNQFQKHAECRASLSAQGQSNPTDPEGKVPTLVMTLGEA
jgi:hypothetical protein